jgi:DNA-binding CsgD family transcriptional regulator
MKRERERERDAPEGGPSKDKTRGWPEGSMRSPPKPAGSSVRFEFSLALAPGDPAIRVLQEFSRQVGFLADLLRSRKDLREKFEKIDDPPTLCVDKDGLAVVAVLGLRKWIELTEREEQVARLIGRGWGNKGIARALSITESTVKKHLTRVFAKSGTSSRAQLLRRLLFEEIPRS